MKISKNVQETVQIEKIIDIICNNCGESLGCELQFNGLVEISVQGAYDSPHLADGTSYVFSLCQKCLSEMFSKFKIEVEVKSYV